MKDIAPLNLISALSLADGTLIDLLSALRKEAPKAVDLAMLDKDVSEARGVLGELLDRITAESHAVVAWTNTDRTEGRGSEVPLAVCEIESTAIRCGKGKHVQGANCPVTKAPALKIDGQMFSLTRIFPPTTEDLAQQERSEKREAALERARKAGLSEDDIQAIVDAFAS